MNRLFEIFTIQSYVFIPNSTQFVPIELQFETLKLRLEIHCKNQEIILNIEEEFK